MDIEQRIAKLSPAKLALLQRRLKRSKAEKRDASAPKSEQAGAYAPLSFAQERLWFLDQMEPDSGLYNLPAIIPLPGRVNASAVAKSVREIVSRHSSFRTRFILKDDSPCQVIGDNTDEAVDFSVIDLRRGDPPLAQQLDDALWAPFKLLAGPLLRVRLFLQSKDENFLLAVMHHIISDGWSINIFINEFRVLYEAALMGRVANLPEPALQYVDYAVAERRRLAGDELAPLLDYWRNRLAGAPSVLGMPFDRPRPARQSFRGAVHPFNVPSSRLRHLKAICRESSLVPFMVLLSAFKILLFRYTNQDRIVVGTPVANRKRSDLEAVIGFFANTLVLSSSLKPNMTFRDLLVQIRDTTLGAYAHQDLPFEKLVLELQPERSLSYNPLFQVMFIFQNLPGENSTPKETRLFDNASVMPSSLNVKFSKFDLTLAMTEVDHGLSAVFEYATDLFEPTTIERMADHFVNILDYMLQHPDEEIGGFSFLSPNERKLVVETWNSTGRKWPEILPLHGRFERQARNVPEATALLFRGVPVSYEELDRRASAVSALLQARGVGRGSIVGICLHRSMEMVIGLLAILKAGGAYMPIEPDFPELRVAYMLENSRARLVLTTSACRPEVSRHQVEVVVLDELDFDQMSTCPLVPSVVVGPTDPAYVIFTSGSTGQPKGVVISHGAIYNRLQWMQERYQLTRQDRVMQKTPYTFDVSVWELFWPLSEGAGLVIAEPDRHKESAYLVELIKLDQVTCLHFVPSMLQLFLHEDLSACRSLKRIICSGEAMTVEQCRKLKALTGVSSHNLYGPTEAAVDVTHWDCAEWHEQYLSVPIGRPIANTQIYIVNEQLQLAPIGVPGELCIGGDNLADGYLNRPDLTREKFIRNPFSGGQASLLYKTGDLARFCSDGNIEYIGRIDSQVKLRGVRIELGEIEHALCRYPGIGEAAVVVNQFGDQDERLIGYVVPEQPEISFDMGAVAAFLGKQLPNYMVPTAIVAIPALPLTANGKLDRKSLPQPEPAKAADIAPSSSVLESELVGIWRKILKVEALRTTDNFFALGGHSILAARLINRINSSYHLNAPVRLLFENPTVESFAQALSEFEDTTRFDESRVAAAMLAYSSLHLLRTLDEATEDQLDEFLRRQADDPAIEPFASLEALLAWSRSYVSSNEDKGNIAAADPIGVSAAADVVQLRSPSYLHCYVELAQIKAAIESAAYSSTSPEPNGGDSVLVSLQERAGALFENFVRQVKTHWSETTSDFSVPAELMAHCGQLFNVAGLAMSIRVHRAPEARSRP